MKIQQLLAARKVFTSRIGDKLPPAVAYKIMKFLKASDNEEAFYNDRLYKIFESYGVKDSKGVLKVADGKINILPDKVEECQAQIDELDKTEVDTPNLALRIDELSPFSLSIVEMATLDDFIIQD